MLNAELPEPNFTPEGRRLESALVKKVKKAIRTSKKIPEEEKPLKIKEWDDYYLKYLHEYNRHYRIQLEKIIYQALTILN
jgi:hypothetical protein